MGQVAEICFLAIVASVILLLTWALLIRLPGFLAEGLARRLMGNRPNVELVARRVRRATYCVAILGVAYLVFGEHSDSFFLGEFNRVTLRPPPPSARVVAKGSTSSSPNGDYCSFSRIWLGATAYQALLDDLAADERFSHDNGGGEPILEKEVRDRVKPLAVVESLTRSVEEHPDWFLQILFLEDSAHIEVSVCDT